MKIHGCLLIFLTVIIVIVKADYWDDRTNLILTEEAQYTGASHNLTSLEEQVNQILMKYKLKELDNGFVNPEQFLAAQHFFKAKEGIERSDVFKIIQKLPKGASLHSHDTGIVSGEFLYNLTFKDNLYGCIKGNGRLVLQFFKDQTNDDCEWNLVNNSRQEDKSFDSYLRSQITLVVDDPDKTYPDINTVWSRFQDIFGTVNNLICYKPVFEEYFYQVLKELYEDNVMYIEFRGLLPEVYDLDGKIYTQIEVAQLYVDILRRFKEDYSDFFGARLIFSPVRRVGYETVENYIETLKKLQEEFPDFTAGFDLVGQEDLGQPLTAFIPQLLEIKNQTKFFFHAGETNWFGETDMNLFDAILLNTTRIGHGYAILKHPLLQELAKERKIALEISPISNQVLKLVEDIRNHPGTVLIADGFPVVICSDDPSFWGAKGLSYDWYLAFMGMSSRSSDLRLLRQLAVNSIIYSAMPEVEKTLAIEMWKDKWSKFLDEIVTIHGTDSDLSNCEL